jgi:hypothetical protein
VLNYEISQLPNYKTLDNALMANTAALSREERKKTKRAARKKRKMEKPLKPREYARGSQKRKVRKLARGQAKR